jgi:heme/copper-type cytochrome/quinol oxidase subunit 1
MVIIKDIGSLLYIIWIFCWFIQDLPFLYLIRAELGVLLVIKLLLGDHQFYNTVISAHALIYDFLF